MKKSITIERLLFFLFIMFSTPGFAGKQLIIKSGESLTQTTDQLSAYGEGIQINTNGFLTVTPSGNGECKNSIYGSGNLTLDASNLTITLTLANVTGTTTIESGTYVGNVDKGPLILKSSVTPPKYTSWKLNGNPFVQGISGTDGSVSSINMSGHSLTIANSSTFNGSISGSGGLTIQGGTSTFGSASSGGISGSGGLTISASSEDQPTSVTLQGVNTYSGTTTIGSYSSLIASTATLPQPNPQSPSAGNIVADGVFIFNQSLNGVSINGTFAGSLSGSGLVVVEKEVLILQEDPPMSPFQGFCLQHLGGV